MAKKKDKKGGKNAKAETAPVATATELPTELRQMGAKLLEMARSPEGTRLIAAGFAVAASAAAVAAERQRERRATDHAPAPANDAVGDMPRAASPLAPGATDPRALAETIATAADALVKGLFGGKRPG